jgi:predicted  nucleic acid-binding Zn-ribbon protein
MSDTQAIAARLTAIAERLNQLEQLTGQSTTLGDVRFLLAHVETLEREKSELTAALHASERFRAEDAGHSLVAQNELRQQRDTAHAALRKLQPFLEEHRQQHRDLNDDSYNNCEGDAECAWCSETRDIIDAALAASAPQKEQK